MRKRLKKNLALITGMMLAVSAMVGILPQTAGTVIAASDKTITGLGTGVIADPTPGAGGWSYVYYGTYGGNNVKYRVLDTQTSDYGGSTMLLDCDSILERMQMDATFDMDRYNAPNDPYSTSYAYSWTNSTIYNWLNGNDFYGNTGVFTAAEKAAIVASSKSVELGGDGVGISYLDFQPLSGEHIFLLDAKEVTNTSYGYPNDSGNNALRVKTGTYPLWWLRSPIHDGSIHASFVFYEGVVDDDSVDHYHGVSPAFNLNLSSVIFSSLISGTSGDPGAAYKLTMKDTNMSVAVTGGSSISRSGTTITVPYTISGSNANNATQVSVVITDSAWTLGTPVTSGYTYLKLTVDTFGTTGTGTFTLPAAYADQTCGTDYYAYIVAEDVNTGNATDYASVPVSVTIPATSGSSISGPTNVPTVTASSEPEPPVNDMQEVEDKISEAIALGGTRVVRIEGYPALSYHVLEMLKEHPQITLVSEFTYDGLDYRITIPGSAVELDPSIKWYGPKYLFPMFYKYGTDTLPAVQAYLDKYESPAS